ncbi:MAG TPA: hypothetical protein VFQ53_14175 [Kofleriaceae bacterium]|nr:hypothetical protein [Kofleriaceae bacterium]
MGQRANYVVVDERGVVELKYSHWAANTVDRDLFWGPAHALAFIGAQRDADGWLDEIWCEGGALVDIPERTLLWFGGEDVRFQVMRHRLYMALLARTWPGWTVRHAFEGLGDLVDYLGQPRDLVRSGREDTPWSPDTWREDGTRLQGVFTLRRRDGRVTAHRASIPAHELLHYPAEVLARFTGVPHLALALDEPTSGAHLDEAARRIDLWSPDYEQDLPARVWPGWQLLHHGARFEEHVARAAGALTLTPISQAAVLEDITSTLMHESKLDPKAILASLVARREGHDIQVNPRFFDHVPRELAADERTAILARAVADLPLLPGFVA